MNSIQKRACMVWLAGFFMLAGGVPALADWQYGAWSRDVAGAKREAYQSNRPLVVMVGNLQSCTYCKSAWNQVLCDGGVHHQPATCTANDTIGGYGVHPLAAYAAEKRLVFLEVDTTSAPELAQQVYSDYRDSYTINEYPFFLVFHVRDGANLNDGGPSALRPTQVDPVIGFIYRGGKIINGIATPPQSALTFDNFRTIVESFFPNVYWQTIAPPVAGSYANAVDLGRLPGEGYPPEPGASWLVTTPKVGGYTLDGAASEAWFKFTAIAGKRYFFTATAIAAPPGVAVDCAVFSSLGGIPYEPAIRSTSGEGFSRLDRGFYVDIAAAGTYFLRISRSPDPAVTGTSFVLRAHETVYDPPVGDSTNPQWTGAVPGQWTMDWAAAHAAAQAEGRPLLVAFTGARWCPWCIGMENQTTDSPQFAQRTGDKYLVMVDNRRRGEITGPALLLDDYPGGYLDSNNISAAAAAAKMQDNLDLQTQLAAPGASTSLGYARIGYPTLLYLRPDSSVVGRVSYLKLQDAAQTAACLDQLAALAADPGEELDNYASQTADGGRAAGVADFVALPAPAQSGVWQEKTAKIGAVDDRDWRVFSPAENGDNWQRTAWLFSVRVPGANPLAQATLAVYDASGTGAADGNLLATVSGSLADGTSLEFVPSVSADHRLLVAVSGQDEVVDYSLRYATREVNNLIAFTAPVFAAVQTSPTAVATVGLTVETPNEGPLTISYRVEEIVAGAVAGVHFATAALEPADFVVEPAEKIDGAAFGLDIPLIAQGLPPWTGSRKFRVVIAPRSNCWIPLASATATVEIYSLPAFGAAATAIEAAQYVPMTPLALPVFDGLGGVLEVAATAGELPDGVEWHYAATGPYSGQVVVSGTPTAPGDFSLTLEAADNLDGTRTPGETITVDIQVKPLAEINPHGVPGSRFAGAILHEPEIARESQVVVGLVSLTIGDLGELSAVVSDRGGSVACTATGWSGIDETGALQATLVSGDPEPAELNLSLAPDGRGGGSYSAPTRELRTVDVLPVPWSVSYPAEDYDGFYTVGMPVAAASRGQGPYQGASHLSFTVGGLGEVTFQGQLSDGTAFSGTGELTEAPGGADCYGRVAFFSPLYGGQGAFGGLFQIVPKSRRELDNACVSSCAVDCFWWQPDGSGVRLDPCGTDFEIGVSLAEQRENTPTFHVTAPVPESLPAGWSNLTCALLPTGVLTTEDGNRLLDPEQNLAGVTIQYDPHTALFSGRFDRFVLDQAGAVATVPTEFDGILTPAGSGCCGADPVPVGRGFYLFDSGEGMRSEPIVLTGLNHHAQTPAPTPCRSDLGRGAPVADGFATHVRFACAAGQAVLLLTSATTRDGGWRTALPGEDIGVDIGEWTVYGGSPGTRHSPGVTFAIAADDLAAHSFATANWHPGWNLVAMPDWKWIDQTSAAAVLERWPVWGVDTASGQIIPAQTLLPARAYWFHVDNDTQRSLPEITGVDWPAGEPSTNWQPKPAWNLTAKPSDWSAVDCGWRWNGGTYLPVTPETSLPADEGGWFHCDGGRMR